jgi:hypothetical protein
MINHFGGGSIGQNPDARQTAFGRCISERLRGARKKVIPPPASIHVDVVGSHLFE